MQDACASLVGEHDFAAFAQADTDIQTTIRTVLKVNMQQTDNDLIEFSIEATGFLKRMVRLIIGTIVQVGKGKITPEDFAQILHSGQKTKHVYAAPPQGLYLKEVKY